MCFTECIKGLSSVIRKSCMINNTMMRKEHNKGYVLSTPADQSQNGWVSSLTSDTIKASIPVNYYAVFMTKTKSAVLWAREQKWNTKFNFNVSYCEKLKISWWTNFLQGPIHEIAIFCMNHEENTMATNFEPHQCIILVQSKKFVHWKIKLDNA